MNISLQSSTQSFTELGTSGKPATARRKTENQLQLGSLVPLPDNEKLTAQGRLTPYQGADRKRTVLAALPAQTILPMQKPPTMTLAKPAVETANKKRKLNDYLEQPSTPVKSHKRVRFNDGTSQPLTPPSRQ